jgi:hypothetical protein
MTTTALQHIQFLPERWARNGLVFALLVLLIPSVVSKEVGVASKEVGFASMAAGFLLFALPPTLIGYFWGVSVRRRLLAVTSLAEATAVMNGLSARCAADGAVIVLIWMFGLWLVQRLQFSFGPISGLIVLPLGAFVGWFVGATFRETLRYRLARTGST